MQRLTSLTLLLISATLVSGCASTGKTYPSLEIRDSERVSGTFESGAAPSNILIAAPLSADITERVVQLEAEAATAHSAFTDATPGARAKANRASGAAIASDRWAEAEVALSDLDSLRSRTAIALGDLDLLFVDATLAFEVRETIGAARQNVEALVAEEDRTLADLRGR